ncbi:MAG: 4-hydroxy-tetrahydrodipicolinate synthase [Ruminococcaceae bacterium]|nr:4-hydroxy-tetrahydrodipicolinate synthase [Oscillospiraceae bacterium]
MSLRKPTLFQGVATALITPFRDGMLDRAALCRLIEGQIEGGAAAILVAGTTGEGSTLSFAEHGEVIEAARDCIRNRVPLLAGCGSNCTDRAVELAKIACRSGADGLLAVTPYYNKGTDSGILKHFQAIAEASSKPVMVYSVPSRTGVALRMRHYRELAKLENVVGVKEASGDLSLLGELCAECGDRLDIYTGNDDNTVLAMRLGAKGVVSVCSNVAPKGMSEICRLCAAGEWKRAAERAGRLRPLIDGLFREVNPVPVKYLAHLMGYCENEYRLPLTSPTRETQRLLRELLTAEVR